MGKDDDKVVPFIDPADLDESEKWLSRMQEIARIERPDGDDDGGGAVGATA